MGKAAFTSQRRHDEKRNIKRAEVIYSGHIFDSTVVQNYQQVRESSRSRVNGCAIAALTDELVPLLKPPISESRAVWAHTAKDISRLFADLSQYTEHSEIPMLDSDLLWLFSRHYDSIKSMNPDNQCYGREALSLSILSAVSYVACRSTGEFAELRNFVCELMPQSTGVHG